jgi:hypothetical protein
VLYALTGINTTSGTGDTIFNALLNQRTFSADNATTAILYSLLVFIGVFSGSLFVLRFLGLFAAVLGIPDDQQIRRGRENQRNQEFLLSSQKRQARLTGQYIVRAQAAMARRRDQENRRRSITSDLPRIQSDQ